MADKNARKIKKFHIPAKDREYLTANLALLIKAGVPIGETLGSMERTTKTPQFKKAMQQMQRDIDDGLPLWQALERSGVVSSQTLALVQLGEESGNLSENLQLASKQEAKQRLFRSRIRSALIYPVFVLSLTGVVGLGVAWFLLPRLSETFTQLNAELPLFSQIFVDLGLFLRTNGLWAVPLALIGLILLIYILFAAPKTKHIGNSIMFHIPGISRLLHEVETARFGYLLGTLLEAGLPVPQALLLLERSTSARRYKKLYAFLAKSIDDGYGLSASLERYKNVGQLLPPSVQQIIMAGERSGSLSETLRDVGDTYEKKSDVTTQNLEVILEPVLLVLVALGVLGLAVAVILPIYQLTGGLG